MSSHKPRWAHTLTNMQESKRITKETSRFGIVSKDKWLTELIEQGSYAFLDRTRKAGVWDFTDLTKAFVHISFVETPYAIAPGIKTRVMSVKAALFNPRKDPEDHEFYSVAFLEESLDIARNYPGPTRMQGTPLGSNYFSYGVSHRMLEWFDDRINDAAILLGSFDNFFDQQLTIRLDEPGKPNVFGITTPFKDITYLGNGLSLVMSQGRGHIVPSTTRNGIQFSPWKPVPGKFTLVNSNVSSTPSGPLQMNVTFNRNYFK